jgi:Protein of unknown function (DUF3352)
VIRRAAIALVACAALLVAGCGSGGGGADDDLASLAPPNASLYLESVIRPEGGQKDAIESLASRVGGIQDPGGAILSRLDAVLAQSGADVSYEKDVQPWLGERGAIFFQSFQGSPPPFAAVVETTDSGAAQAFLEKVTASDQGISQATYNGVKYFTATNEGGSIGFGVVGDFLVFGTLDQFKAAVDASNGSSLADSSNFQDATATVPSDNLGLGYVDSAKAIGAVSSTMNPLEAVALKPLLANLASGPAGFSVSGRPDEASLDVSLPSSGLPPLAGGDMVGRAPADAWFAIGAQDLGATLGNALDTVTKGIPGAGVIESRIHREAGVNPSEALSWMQGGYAFVGGTSEDTINIGGVVQSADTQASSKDVQALRKKFQADADAKLGPPTLPGADAGFSASAPESPQAIEVDQVGDQVVAALGPGQPAQNALQPEHKLADDPSFVAGQGALGADFEPLAFVSLDPFFVVAEKGGQANDPQYLAAKPYLQHLDYLMVGSRTDTGRTTLRFAVGVK